MLERIHAWLERRRRFLAALAYNGRYTFAFNHPHGHSWMCPRCNCVQRAHSVSKFGGPQFHACCDLPAGNRDERRFALPYSVI